MVEKRLTFTVDGDAYDRLCDDLDDESVDEWVRDAIRRKLGEDGDDYYEGPGEFVDDCSI